MAKKKQGSTPQQRRQNPNAGDDDNDNAFLDEAVAKAAVDSKPKSTMSNSRITMHEARSRLALFALVSAVSPLILREVFGLSLDKDMVFLGLATAAAAVFQYGANMDTLKSMTNRQALSEHLVWKTLLLNGAFSFFASLILMTYLFDYFFDGILATLSDDNQVNELTRMKAKYFTCIVLPSVTLFTLRLTRGF